MVERVSPIATQEALLQAYPALIAVLRGEHGLDLQRELTTLLSQAYPERSTRKIVRVIAKMVRKLAEMEVEESVLVHDISETGMSVTISNHSNVALAEILAPVFVVRVAASDLNEPVPQAIRLAGRLVRIVTTTDTGTVAAFRFDEVALTERQGLYDVVQWVNPKERRTSLVPKTTPT